MGRWNQRVVRAQIKRRKAKGGTPEYTRVKQGMVDAAIELMAEKGFSKFRFEDLAEKVGYNRATIYRYFDGKQDLITCVMLTLMHEMTSDIIQQTAGTETVTRESFTDALFKVITDLRCDRRYAIVMDAGNVEAFARLTHEYFSAITTSMLEKFMVDGPAGRVLQAGIGIDDAVHWLMHQIISYGFFGLNGDDERQQKAYLEKMVIAVIMC